MGEARSEKVKKIVKKRLVLWASRTQLHFKISERLYKIST